MIADILTFIAGALFLHLAWRMREYGDRVTAVVCIAVGLLLMISAGARQLALHKETQVISNPVPPDMRR